MCIKLYIMFLYIVCVCMYTSNPGDTLSDTLFSCKRRGVVSPTSKGWFLAAHSHGYIAQGNTWLTVMQETWV